MALDKQDVRSTVAGDFLNTEANSAAIKTAVELIDNAVSGAGFNITQLNGATVPIGGGVEATAVRVTVASDSTGVLSIDDNGGSITVDGTVTATNPSVDVDDAAFTPATDSVTVIGGFADETATDSVDEGDVGAIRMSLDRRMLTDSNIQVGNADVSGTNPVPVTITNVEASGITAVAAQSTTASLAAQASETDEFLLGSNVTASLQSVTIAADVAFKAVIQKVDETPTTTTIATLYGEPGATVQWQPRNPNAALHKVASDGTPTAKYQVVLTNNGITSVGGSGTISVHLEHDEVAN